MYASSGQYSPRVVGGASSKGSKSVARPTRRGSVLPIDRNDKLEVLARTDLAALISEYVSLKKAGRDFKGLCPFHQEKTPSFNVQPERQIWHCFGCGEGGDAIGFLMKIENMRYPEAVESLARRAGVTLTGRAETPEDRRERGRREGLLKLMRRVANHYHQLLIGDPRAAGARSYLKEKRGLADETIEKYRLGYAPESWEELVGTLKSWGEDSGWAESLGLVRKRERGGGCYDFFRDRIIIPIQNTRGETIAFGARIMGAGEPKYLNSPESPVYNKRETLFGLDVARRKLGEETPAIVVEGYFDAISLHEAGLENVVATCGTALAREHLRVLRRYTRDLVMLYDADEAGVKAATGKLDLLLDEGMRPSFVVMPEGEDPDTLVRKEGGKALQKRIDGAMPLVRFTLERLFPEAEGAAAADRVRIMNRAAPILSRIREPVERGYYSRWLAEKLGVPEESVLSSTAHLSRREASRRRARREREAGEDASEGEGELERAYGRLPTSEERLVHLLLHFPELGGKVAASGIVGEMEDKVLAGLVGLLCRRKNKASPLELLSEIDDEKLAALVAKLSSDEESLAEVDESELLAHLLGRIRERADGRRAASLKKEGGGGASDPLGDREALRRHLEATQKAKNPDFPKTTG